MGVGAQKNLGGHQTFAWKMTLNFAQFLIGFSVQIKVTSKKKKSLHWNWDSLMSTIANLPKKYEIAQNFDALLPK